MILTVPELARVRLSVESRLESRIVYRVAVGDGAVVSLMSSNSWTDRRAAVGSRLLIVLLVAGSLVLSGCGLFGGDDETPSEVEPPESVTQTEQQDTSAAGTVSDADEEQGQPADAVRVTTSPDQESEAEQETQAAEPEQEEVDRSVYVVQAGDTLADIADRLGVRLDDLITLNGIQNPDRISVGQVLQVPVTQESGGDTETGVDDTEEAQQSEESEDEDDPQVEPPPVTLPTVAVPAATPTRVSYTQFPQPGSDETSETIPNPPANFLQYGAAALPWLHGIAEVTPIIELFKAWPMPPLAVGSDRVVLVDTGGFRELLRLDCLHRSQLLRRGGAVLEPCGLRPAARQRISIPHRI